MSGTFASRPTSEVAGGSLRGQSRSLGDSALDDFLRRVNLWRGAVMGATLLALSFTAFVVAMNAVVLLDAAFAWSNPVRIVVDLAFLAAIAIGLSTAIVRMWRARYEPRRVARMAEVNLSRADSLLVNAVDFRRGAGQGSAVLQKRVERLADDWVRTIDCADVVPARPAVRAAALAALAAVVCIAAILAAPRLFGMVLPRYFDPLGDHPPYTLFEFGVEIMPQPVYHSRPATIRVSISGPEPVDRAELVFVDDRGRPDPAWGSIPTTRSDAQTFTAVIARADRSARFYVQTPQSRSPQFEFPVAAVPFIEESSVTLEFPGYTRWKPALQKLDRRGLRGFVGTKATVVVRSNLPLRSGQMAIVPAQRPGETTEQDAVIFALAPRRDDPHAVEGSFPVEFNGRFELHLKSADGVDSVEPISGPITAVPDHAPRVSIAAPQQHLVVVEGWKVPVVIDASDDVAVASLRLFRTVNGWSPIPVAVQGELRTAQQIRGMAEFDLEALGARAGDVVTYYASVADNRPESPQSADSPIHTLQIISQEEYREFARQQYRLDELAAEFAAIREQLDALAKQRERLIEELEWLRKKVAGTDPLAADDHRGAEQLRKPMQEFARETAELKSRLEERARQMPLYEMEKEYAEELQSLAEQLERQSHNATALDAALKPFARGESPSTEQRLELEAAAAAFQQDGEPFEGESQAQQQAATDDLKLLQQADALLAQTDRLKGVVAQQRDLANRLAEFAGKEQLSSEEHSRAERFGNEQEVLEQELTALRENLEKAATAAEARLPKMAASGRELGKKIEELEIAQDQQGAARGAREGNGDAAHRLAESGARKLESLQSLTGQCEQCNGLGEGLDGPLSLSPERLSTNMKQLSQGRKLPGLGRKPGQGQSPGEGGRAGDGQAEQDGPGQAGSAPWRPGQSFPGMSPESRVLGPRTQQQVASQAEAVGPPSDGRGQMMGPQASQSPGNYESLNPETRHASGANSGNLRGVPVGYRDAAEAYFRRLSEEWTSP